MPFKIPSILGKKSADQPKKEASLEDILPNTKQRSDLLALVTACTHHMRNGLSTVLDNSVLSKPTNSASNGDHTSTEAPVETQQEQPRLQKADSAPPRLQDLRRAGLEYMDTWRDAVLKRMAEALSLKPDAIEESQSKSTQLVTSEQPPLEALPFPDIALPATLQELEDRDRALVLGAILFMLISLERYPAHSRVLMAYLCQCFELPYDVLSSEEATTAVTLLEAAAKADTTSNTDTSSSTSMSGETARQKLADLGATSRRIKIGIATVAGAVVIGVTGGLAAPLIIGVAGAIMGGVGLSGLAVLLGTIILNPVTIAGLFGALGARMTSQAMKAYSKEVQDFEFLPISEQQDPKSDEEKNHSQTQPSVPNHKLRVAIGISGWVVEETDISRPWLAFSSTTLESFALQYEKAAMTALGSTLNDFLKSNAYGMVRSAGIQMVLPALSQALAPVGLLKAGRVIDNPFTIAMERSDKAGKVLAHALVDKVQGERPVTLIGFSLGARVIFSCLDELANQNAFGLIENAILMGAPVPSSESSWRRMRAIVVGRLVNVYTQRDMILSYLYRARNLQFGIAGLQPIAAVPGIENKDVSDLVTGHNQYRFAVGPILQDLNFPDLDLTQVRRERDDLERERQMEEKVHEQAKAEGKLDDIEDEQGNIKLAPPTEDMRRVDHDAVDIITTTTDNHSNPSESKSVNAEIPTKDQDTIQQNLQRIQLAEADSKAEAGNGNGNGNEERPPTLPPRANGTT